MYCDNGEYDHISAPYKLLCLSLELALHTKNGSNCNNVFQVSHKGVNKKY